MIFYSHQLLKKINVLVNNWAKSSNYGSKNINPSINILLFGSWNSAVIKGRSTTPLTYHDPPPDYETLTNSCSCTTQLTTIADDYGKYKYWALGTLESYKANAQWCT